MTHLHFQPVGGAAGDMILASLISAGAPLEEVSRNLQPLGVRFELRAERVEVNGVGAIQATVVYPGEHVHRNFTDIKTLIEASNIPDRAVERATKAFYRLAVAEGTVHQQEPEDVTFHEVGAVDSIVDVMGSCVALELLEADTVSCGPLPMGSGVVSAAHGVLPVPGPATLEVLKGSRVRWTEEPHEMTTPTGAAVMHALTGGEFTESAPPMVLREVGYGTGHAQFDSVPNLLRAAVGEIEGAAGEVELLEANVDDAPGELFGAAAESLLEAGALDAWLEPITMKRGRGAYKVCALIQATDRNHMARLLMRETGTLGVRHFGVGRTVAERRIVEVDLPYGKCRVKVGSLDGDDYVVSPEYADVLQLTRDKGLPLVRVYNEVRAAYERQRPEEQSPGPLLP
ncbi:MAG: nickel pincer cofactor biosynthesis protein LarC [Rubrobacteraceae bacterium]